MSSEKEHIDKLLKQSFEHFSPDAPDVWNAVQQGVQATISQAGWASKMLSTIKGASVITKTITVVGGLLLAGSIVYFFIPENQTEINEPIVVDNNNPLENTEPEAVKIIDKSLERENVVKSESKKVSVKAKQFIQRKETEITTEKDELAMKPVDEKKDEPEITQPEPDIQEKTIELVVDDKVETTVEQEENETATERSSEGKLVEVELPNPIIPGAFSPDGDGLNDVYKIIIEQDIIFDLKILNKEDEIVFESRNKEVMWDGLNIKNGQPCEDGLYAYTFRYQQKGGKEVVKSGVLKLSRSK